MSCTFFMKRECKTSNGICILQRAFWLSSHNKLRFISKMGALHLPMKIMIICVIRGLALQVGIISLSRSRVKFIPLF